jgi:Raf kinase inhibitor-like YbhB/YbcL family protein
MADIDLRSPDFADSAPIPDRNARAGQNVPPTLTWSSPPAGTAELALLVEDPDAPRETFVHWVVAGIPPARTRIDAGRLPPGAVQGRNGFGTARYDGPQPPAGDPPHRYVFRVFAADAPLGVPDGASADALRAALRGHELASGTLVGVYQAS